MDEPEKEPEIDPVFEELITNISNNFRIADNYAESTLQLSTQEVFERLQRIYPSRSYSQGDVYKALNELGYKYDDPHREMEFKWLFVSK